MLKRKSVIAGVAIAALLGTAAPALADGPFGSVDCDQNPQPVCQLEAGNGGGSNGGGGGNGSGGGNGNAATGNPNCGSPLDPLCSLNGAIQNGVPSPAEVARLARSQLRLPPPGIAASPAGDQLVNLPTWLWLDRGSWGDVSATASVPGVSVTAVARPTSVTWSMGDGNSVTCNGPGTAFPSGADPKSASPDCGYTYRTSSAGQRGEAFPVTATVHWTVTWSGAGQGGTFPNMTTTRSAAFRVAESQGIATG